MLALMFLMMFASVSACRAEDYWVTLHVVADSCFTGRDTKVVVGGGIEQRTFDNGSTTAPFAEIKFEVPLYSAKDRRTQRQAKAKFLEHGADLIRDLKKAESRLKVKREEAEVLKTAMMQEGLSAIRAFFTLKEEIEETKAEITAYKHKLEGWFSSCGKK